MKRVLGASLVLAGFLVIITLIFWPAAADPLASDLRLFAVKPEMHLRLTVEPSQFVHLSRARDSALSRGFLLENEQVFVPATLSNTTTSVPARIRLKGDLPDHWDGKEWSFRVEISNGKSLQGLTRFSIQHPSTRHGLAAWVFQRHLKHEGLVGVGARFVSLSLNRENLGIYLLEEQMDRAFIEKNGLRAGPVLRFDETGYWRELSTINQVSGLLEAEGQWERDLHGATIVAYEASDFAPELLQTAMASLQGLRSRTLKPSQVLHVVKMARYLALLDLYGSGHAAAWHNLRLYFDPVTHLFEPIGFDSDYQRVRSILGVSQSWSQAPVPVRDTWLRTLLSDPVMEGAYTRELERISRDNRVQQFLALVDQELGEDLEIVRDDWPRFNFDEDVLHDNRSWIRSQLNPARHLEAWLQEIHPDRLCFIMQATAALPVEVFSVSVPGVAAVTLSSPALLPSRNPGEAGKFAGPVCVNPLVGQFPPPQALAVTLHSRVIGTTQTRQTQVRKTPVPKLSLPEKSLSLPPFIHLSGNQAVISTGAHTLTTITVLPQGVSLRASPGTTLSFNDGGVLVVRGPLYLEGEDVKPVVMQGHQCIRCGILVMNAQGKSLVSHTRFRNLGEPRLENRMLTGAVTFQESPVIITDTVFSDNQSEDSLNCIRSAFELVRVVFHNSPSDAFDADFSSGSISASRVYGTRGDGIDLAGSSVRIENSNFGSSQDKCISIGENSEVFVLDTNLSDCDIGVAAKDGSRARLERVLIKSTRLGLAAYVKKTEYGGVPEIHGTDLRFQDVVQQVFAEEGSVVQY